MTEYVITEKLLESLGYYYNSCNNICIMTSDLAEHFELDDKTWDGYEKSPFYNALDGSIKKISISLV